MKQFLILGLLVCITYCNVYCQVEKDELVEELNIELVNRLNEILDRDYKVAKIKSKKTFIEFGKNAVHTSIWITLKSKFQKQFIKTLELDKILSEQEIVDYYNLDAFIHSVHVGFHAYIENFKFKEKKRIGKNMTKSEKFCVDLYVTFWKEQESYAEDFETYKGYVDRIYNADHIQEELKKINWKKLKEDVNPLVALKFNYDGLFKSDANSFDSVVKSFKRQYRL